MNNQAIAGIDFSPSLLPSYLPYPSPKPLRVYTPYFQASPTLREATLRASTRENLTTKHENNSLTLGEETPPLLLNSELRTPYFQVSPL